MRPSFFVIFILIFPLLTNAVDKERFKSKGEETLNECHKNSKFETIPKIKDEKLWEQIKDLEKYSFADSLNIDILNSCPQNTIKSSIYDIYNTAKMCAKRDLFTKKKHVQEAFEKWFNIFQKNKTTNLDLGPILITCEKSGQGNTQIYKDKRKSKNLEIVTPEVAGALAADSLHYPTILINQETVTADDLNAALFHEFFHIVGFDHDEKIDYAYLLTGCCFEKNNDFCQILAKSDNSFDPNYILSFVQKIGRPLVATHFLDKVLLKIGQKTDAVIEASIELDKTYVQHDEYQKTEERIYNYLRCQSAAVLNDKKYLHAVNTNKCKKQFIELAKNEDINQFVALLAELQKSILLKIDTLQLREAIMEEIQKINCTKIPYASVLIKRLTKNFDPIDLKKLKQCL